MGEGGAVGVIILLRYIYIAKTYTLLHVVELIPPSNGHTLYHTITTQNILICLMCLLRFTLEPVQ